MNRIFKRKLRREILNPVAWLLFSLCTSVISAVSSKGASRSQPVDTEIRNAGFHGPNQLELMHEEKISPPSWGIKMAADDDEKKGESRFPKSLK